MALFPPSRTSYWLRSPSGAVVLLTLGYLLYLAFSGYSQLYFDAGGYWNLTTHFLTPERQFSLLQYDVGDRGYSWPLLLFPLRAARLLGGSAIWYTQGLGALLAGLIFGWLGPRLYQRLPLHLLLAAAATLGWPQKPVVWRWVRAYPTRSLLLTGLFGLAVLGCFRVSADTQAHLELGARLPSGLKAPAALLSPPGVR